MTDYVATIVIPTFNRASLVKKAIDSALSQTVNCEVIVCDHGSTDNTVELISYYGEKIKYIRREKDYGPIFSWLDGIISSNSEYVHITYDDDWIDNNFIEKTINLITSECAFVFTSAFQYSDPDVVSTINKNLFDTGIHEVNIVENLIMNRDRAISPGCALFRKQDMIDSLHVGRIPFAKHTYKGVGPDMLMFLLPLLKYKKFGYIDEPLAHFRAHDYSITIDALRDLEKTKKINDSYKEAKIFYLISKLVKNCNLQNKIYFIYRKINYLKQIFRKFSNLLSQ